MSPRRLPRILGALALALAGGCNARDSASTIPAPGDTARTIAVQQPPVPEPGTEIAIFAGGCFWCMEPPFDALEGVISTTSGYAGGSLDQPTYQEVSSGRTGHLEVLEVVYRPDQVRYEELLEVFWHNVDPLDAGGQFCDRGPQYATAIFTRTPAQREAAEASKAKIQAELDAPVVTPIRDAGSFFAAEEYHQDFYKRSPIRYKFYRQGCGRDARLNQLWSRSAG